MTTAAVQIVMLTDEQLEREIADTLGEVCCATEFAAARSLCGCGGRAAAYLERLIGESRRREHEVNP